MMSLERIIMVNPDTSDVSMVVEFRADKWANDLIALLTSIMGPPLDATAYQREESDDPSE
jgi:hypothetical protein